MTLVVEPVNTTVSSQTANAPLQATGTIPLRHVRSHGVHVRCPGVHGCCEFCIPHIVLLNYTQVMVLLILLSRFV